MDVTSDVEMCEVPAPTSGPSAALKRPASTPPTDELAPKRQFQRNDQNVHLAIATHRAVSPDQGRPDSPGPVFDELPPRTEEYQRLVNDIKAHRRAVYMNLPDWQKDLEFSPFSSPDVSDDKWIVY